MGKTTRLMVGCAAALIAAVALSAPAFAAEQVVKIVTLDWPPYTGKVFFNGAATTVISTAEPALSLRVALLISTSFSSM